MSTVEVEGISSEAVKCVDIGRNTNGEGTLLDLSMAGVEGISSVAVKCVDIRKNTSGESALLDHY